MRLMGRDKTLKVYRRSMSFQMVVPPRNTDNKSKINEISDNERVIESSITCRKESEATYGIKRNIRVVTMIPEKPGRGRCPSR